MKFRTHRCSPVQALLLFVMLAPRVEAQFAQQGVKLVGGGAVGAAQQGASIALSADGNTALIGGNADNGGVGAAWVWTRSGGTWTQQGGKLIGMGATGTAQQGVAVALSADGNTALIGGNADNSGAGAAWVWTRSGGTWTQQGGKLIGMGATGVAQQGVAVALSADGNTALIGGNADNGGAGAAWVWTRSGGTWTQQGEKLVGTGAVGIAQQGQSVSLSADGSTALVGGFVDNNYSGAAWVWTRAGSVWMQQGGKLVGAGAVGAPWQGRSVALSADGNTALIGGYADNGVGAAWIWTRTAGNWLQQGAKLTGGGAVGNPYLGESVALSSDGNIAIVGGYSDNAQSGAAWMWMRSSGTWTQMGSKLVGTGAVGGAQQGESVALSGDGGTALVGGYVDNNGAGAIWVWTRPPADPVLIAPENNAASVPVSTVLTWNPSSGAASYRVQLSTDSTFVTTVVNDSVTTGASRAVGPLANNAVYFWRVMAKGSGGTSAYSPTRKFSTIFVPPLAPVLASPPQNAAILSVAVNLTWIALPNATAYQVQVSTNSGFTFTVLNDSTLSATTRIFSSFDPNTNYYWRVRARNNGGAGPYSVVWNFNTGTTAIMPKEFARQDLKFEKNGMLKFDMPRREHVVINLFDSEGRVVSRLLNESLDAGSHALSLPVQPDSRLFLDFRAGEFHRTLKIQPAK